MNLRKLILFLLIVLNIQTVFSITFDKLKHQFGVIKEENGIVSTVFTFTNTTKQAISISRIHSACGCSVAQWDANPILIGQKSTITVFYNPEERPGAFEKNIYVYTNDSTVRLSILGTVIPSASTIAKLYPFVFRSLRSDKNTINFGEVIHTQEAVAYLTLINTAESEVIVSFLSNSKIFKPQETIYKFAPFQEIQVPIKLIPIAKNPWGLVSERIVIVENNTPTNAVQLQTYITEDFSILSAKDRKNTPKAVLSTNELNFGKIKQTKISTKEINLSNKGNRTLFIRSVLVNDPAITVNYRRDNVARNKAVTLSITLDSSKTFGEKDFTVQIFTNDPVRPIQTVSIKANVHK